MASIVGGEGSESGLLDVKGDVGPNALRKSYGPGTEGGGARGSDFVRSSSRVKLK